ncbi:MAG: hypothetical protein U0231_01260 [Nitrospiraceae bacterium]
MRSLSDGSGYRFLREVAVGPGHGLKDVVITIDGVEKGKAFDLAETKLEANICQFVSSLCPSCATVTC